jgi:hypothetical protein
MFLTETEGPVGASAPRAADLRSNALITSAPKVKEVEPSNRHPAVQVFLSFFAEMNAWETEMSHYHHSTSGVNTSKEKLAQDRAIHRKHLEEIFEKYCEVGAKCKRLEDEGLSFNLDSPEHDLENERIESVVVKPGKVIIETKQPHPRGWR